MTPAQLRGARAITGLKQDELADLAKVSRETIIGIESGRRRPQRNNLAAIVRALEGAGVQFGNDGSVRLRSNGQ
jgi:DNA-binding XRE family transcriptional regulator